MTINILLVRFFIALGKQAAGRSARRDHSVDSRRVRNTVSTIRRAVRRRRQRKRILRRVRTVAVLHTHSARRPAVLRGGGRQDDKRDAHYME